MDLQIDHINPSNHYLFLGGIHPIHPYVLIDSRIRQGPYLHFWAFTIAADGLLQGVSKRINKDRASDLISSANLTPSQCNYYTRILNQIYNSGAPRTEGQAISLLFVLEDQAQVLSRSVEERLLIISTTLSFATPIRE
jgi:hypothetical protein